MKQFVLSALAVFALFGAAQAQTANDIAVESVWARATPPGAKTGAVYFTVVNKGAAEDKLVAAETPAAGKAQLHSITMDNGVMKMRPIASLAVPAGGEAALKPGGNHLMLTGLTAPLKQGATFPLTLQFEHAGKIEVQVEIARAGATMPPGMKMDDDMGDMKDMNH
jgi:periplasmic copper chaperone A